jgi:capsular polysaccharide biosynthesis protein
MELLLYWRILKRRLWLVGGLLVLVLASYVVLTRPPQPTYSAGMRFVVGLRPEPTTGEYYTYDHYYTWLTAEYLLDDLAEVVKSGVFAQDVAAQAGLAVPVGAIQGATSAGKLHRILSVQITWPNPQELERIANATAYVLQTQADKYFAQLATPSAVIALIDPPHVAAVGPSLRQRLDLPLRLLLALVAGVALAFVWDYFDQSLRDGTELEAWGLPVLGEIPAERHAWWPRRLRVR